MTCRTVPAGNQGTGRGDTLVGAVAGESATAIRMERTARQACIQPGLLANVLRAGEATFKAQLHRPLARTAATVAGLLLSTSPNLVPQVPLRREAVAPLRNPLRPAARSTPPRNRITGGVIDRKLAGGLRITESNNNGRWLSEQYFPLYGETPTAS